MIFLYSQYNIYYLFYFLLDKLYASRYQALQLQYPAVVLSFFCEHLCLALKDFLRFGLLFFIFNFLSPKLTFLMLPVFGFLT